jgi:alkylhydroperoxidase family enzyme
MSGHADTHRSPRIELVPDDVSEPAEIVDALRTRRGGGLYPIDRVLLHSPEIALGWSNFAGAVRTKSSLEPKLRELVICGVGVLNGSAFELEIHAPEFLAAGGTQEQLDAMADFVGAASDVERFTETERAVMQLVVESTRGIEVSDETFERAVSLLPDLQSVVEVVVTVGMYNMASRVLTAFHL